MNRIAFFIFLLLPFLLPAQGTYNYTLSWSNPAEHTYSISLRTPPHRIGYSEFQLPAWRPGRYYKQDYAAAVSGFRAEDDEGNALEVVKTTSNTWRVTNPSRGSITIHYRYYANYMDAGSSVLDAEQAYFNPVNLFMHVDKQYERPCTLRVESMPKNWKAGTALKSLSGQHGVFTAESYHDFVDSPTVLSPTLKTLQSRIDGVDFYFHFQGTFPDDKATEDAYQGNLDKIIREQWAIFQDMPLKEYHFIYQLLPYNMGHAVEHKYSSMFALPDRMTSSPEAIQRANGISAHEFFHLWNVKRIRPAALLPYDYQDEQYTSLHWFTEGVTEYYTHLTLVRAGLIDRDGFYRILARMIGAIENNPASKYISPAQSSMDSWLARSEYTPDHQRISYYTQGFVVGLLLDAKMRSETNGKATLDDLMWLLYRNYHQAEKGVGETDLKKEIERLTGGDYNSFFRDHVFGTVSPDYVGLLAGMGLELGSEDRTGTTWRHVGLVRTEKNADGHLEVKMVLPGSDAAKAGISKGMAIEMVNGKPMGEFDAEAFFYSFKAGKSLELQTRNRDVVQSHRLEWTNQGAPQDYFVRENRRMKKKTRKLLDAWLASKVGK